MIFRKKGAKKGSAEDPQEDKENDDDSKNISESPDKNNVKNIAEIAKLTAQIEKLKAQFQTAQEMQKASMERFSIFNEQIGSLRTMILDRDKDSKMLEAKATQAIDMVESVQPDKLMMELKKVENRMEMLRSPIESNEAMIHNAISELKEIRTKFNTFKGIDESIRLADEVKKAWIENKKIDANITKHSSKVETIYSDMWKKFRDFERTSTLVADIDKALKQITTEVDTTKIKMNSFVSKKEYEELIIKLDAFEKHMNLVISVLNNKISNFDKEFTESFNKKMEKATKLVRGFETLAAKTPGLDKYFNLLEKEARKNIDESIKVEKIKNLGEDEKVIEEKKEDEENKNFFSKIKEKFKKENNLEEK